ncbi:MAG: hypothetical protein SCK28_07270 [Bacillota bacterium]|nr:hypothetical protein [Bacillota bacterium]
MTTLIVLGVIFALMLGFSVSGLVISSKFARRSGILRNTLFVLFGSLLSAFVMVLMVLIVWPTHMVI